MRADCLPKRSSGSGGGSASGGGGVHPKGGGVALGRVALVLSDHFGTGYPLRVLCPLYAPSCTWCMQCWCTVFGFRGVPVHVE